MEVVYCSSCGKRIPQEELGAGRAVRSGTDCYCAECIAKGATPVGAPAPGVERQARPAPARRVSGRHVPSGMSARSAGILVGLLVTLGAGIYFGFLRGRRRTAARKRVIAPSPAVVRPPAPEGPRPKTALRAREEPPPVEGHKWVPVPPPTPAPEEHKYVPVPPPETARPAPSKTGVPPDPPAPFALKEGEMVLYSWDWRRWLPGMQGKRMIVRPGLNLLHTDSNCGTAWTLKGTFTVPEHGIIRARFLVTQRLDVHLLVGVEGRGNQRHTWVRVEPGKWFEGVVAMDDMRPWEPTAEPVPLPPGLKTRQVLLYIDEDLPGSPHLYVSEIQAVAVE